MRHSGPIPENFHERFGLGTDEETIAELDFTVVTLGAMQGLSAELEKKEGRIEELEERQERSSDLDAENEQLKERLAALEEAVDLESDHGSR